MCAAVFIVLLIL